MKLQLKEFVTECKSTNMRMSVPRNCQDEGKKGDLQKKKKGDLQAD